MPLLLKEKVYTSDDGKLINIPSSAKVEMYTEKKSALSNSKIEIVHADDAVRSFTLESGERYVAAYDNKTGKFLGYQNFEKKTFYQISKVFSLLNELYAVEAGYNDVKGDVPTNFGVTIGLFKRYAKELGYTGTVDDLKKITGKDAANIYLNEFWNPMKFEEIIKIDKSIAIPLFETTVNTYNEGFEELKKAINEVGGYNLKLNVSVNQDFLSALKNVDREKVYNKFISNMQAFYKKTYDDKLKKEGVKMGGWLTKMDKYVGQYKK